MVDFEMVYRHSPPPTANLHKKEMTAAVGRGATGPFLNLVTDQHVSRLACPTDLSARGDSEDRQVEDSGR